jgi:hypothetical protein
MDLSKVIFLGGDPAQLASVKIRCVDLAQRLGCDVLFRARTAEAIPDRYSVFVCVKPRLRPEELPKLARRGRIVWDIIDSFPPRESVAAYLASNSLTQELFDDYGRVEVIPHYHCNFEGRPNPPGNRRPVWLGSHHWLPQIRGFAHDTHFINGLTREDVVKIFRQTGIGLNLRGGKMFQNQPPGPVQAGAARRGHRRPRDQLNFHIAINSGIKLINCLGFGIPSISSDEPAYHEMGEDCTIFSNLRDCAKWVRALQHDDDLYRDLRQRCLRKSRRFHIDVIAEKYRKFFSSL